MMSRKFLGYLCLTLFSLTSLQVEGKAAKTPNIKAQYDYVIVGAGTAGAVIARKLSDNFKNSVLVLEAGENLSHNPEVLDPNIFDSLLDLTFNPKFAVTYSIPLNGGFDSLTYSEGRMWGGSSAHNYLLAVRGTPSIYNAWANLSGNKQWNYKNVLPTILDIETYTGTSEEPSLRGTDGPIFLTQSSPAEVQPFSKAMAKALKAPFQPDYNVSPEGNISTAVWQNFITPPGPDSQRSFSITGYLPNGDMPDAILTIDGEGLDGRDLTVVSNAAVSRVTFNKNNKAVGVEFILSPSSDSEETLTVKAKKKIILCAGAIRSPAILQRSGIGDAKLLESLGINVVFDNPNVGQHLSNQYGPGTLIAAESNQFLTSYATGFPFFPNDGVRRMQFIFFPGSLVAGNNFIMAPKSRGSVNIVSTNPLFYPDLELNMFSDGPFNQKGTDAYTAVSMLKLARKIARQSGGELLQPPPETFKSDALLFQYASSVAHLGITDHITGTTRMAKSPNGKNGGVVDGNLHVFGVENLMIADLGIAPKQPDGNPCFPVYVIGSVAADIVLSGQ